MPFAAQVVEILRRTGSKGVIQVKCKLLEGDEKGKILLRNIYGPVKVGDIILLKEIELETVEKIEEKWDVIFVSWK